MKTEQELRAIAAELHAQHRAIAGDGKLTRAMHLELSDIEVVTRDASGTSKDSTDADDDTRIDVALSSEAPVERYDFWTDERYLEVLDHSPNSVDLSRAGPGMPFLVDHDARDWKSHLGTLTNVRVDATTKKLRGTVRFSRRADAQDLKRDMLDGIRPKISIGYRVDPANMEVSKPQTDGGLKTVRYKRWTPLEGSSVSIPADEAAGVGRSLGSSWDPADVERLRALIQELNANAAPKAQERNVSDTTTAAPSGAAPDQTTAPDLKVVRGEVREEVKRISELAKTHNMSDRLADWLSQGLDESAVRGQIMETYRERAAKPVAQGGVAVELTARERKQYDLKRGIDTQIAAIDGRRGETTSFETEISDTLARKAPDGYKRMGGLMVPMCTDPEVARLHNMANERGLFLRRQFGEPQVATRTGLYTGSAAAGGDLKFTVPGEFLELLRNYMAVYAAGASYMTGLQGPVAFPQQITAATAYWVAENPGSDVSDSNLTLQQVTLSPNTIQASTSYSRQLWIQSVVDVDGMVKQDLAAINALALDLAAITGTGSSNQPTGILNWSGTSLYAMGTNGGTPGYADLVNMETDITAANADQWPLTYLVHPTTRGTFKKATPLSATNGIPVWTDSATMGVGAGLQSGGTSRKKGELNGYDAWASAQVPNALTKGTSSNCLAGIFGAFPTLVIGDWGMFEIIVDPYRLKKQGMIELTSFAMYGIALKYAAAFAVCKDFLP